MKRMWIALLLIAAAPQDQDPQKVKDNSAELKKLDWMIGVWKGSGSMEPFGDYDEEISFEWTLKKNFIKVGQKVWLKGKFSYTSTGMLGWDFKEKKYSWFQFGIDGTIGWTTSAESEKKTLVVVGQVSGEEMFNNHRTTYTWIDDDSLKAKMELKKDGKYETVTEATYKRQKEADKTEAPKAESKPAEKLADMDWIIGTWKGSGEMMGQKYEDKYVYTWAMNRNYLHHHYEMSMGGKVMHVDTGYLGWDKTKKKLVAFAFGLDGTIGWGEEAEAKENEWTWDGGTSSPTHTMTYRVTMKKIDKDTFSITMQSRKGDKYEDMMTSTYKREKEKKDD